MSASETFLGGRVIVRQPEQGFRGGLDAVMLAAAVPDGATALELGAGAGTASLCLAQRLSAIAITGLEVDPELVRLAAENAAANSMQARVRFAAANIFALPLEFKREYDCVLANPPFHGEGQVSADPARARALMDEGTLGDWLQAGLKRTRSGGTFTTVLRADRLNEALLALPLTGVSVLPLWPRTGAAARRVLIQVRKNSGAAFHLGPGLILHDETGTYTPEAEGILRGEAALALGVPRL
ncbi:MAG TPA: methyltransferase [Rhizomicrobium sp.]